MAYDRKEIVLTRRLEGAKAAQSGKHPNTCPYHDNMDAFQWAQGFNRFMDTKEDAERWGTVEDHEAELVKYLEKRQYYTNKFREGL
jgi:ribosome modulation factor